MVADARQRRRFAEGLMGALGMYLPGAHAIPRAEMDRERGKFIALRVSAVIVASHHR